ncbi:MAG: hypothetical protein GVY06_11065 [Alphaproteobacteria bacterium]|nr:hypothetical protein [Alphaproteobacteria bacterium]
MNRGSSKSRARRPRASGPRGNRLDRLGDVNRIGRFWQNAEVTPAGETVEFMQYGDEGLRPFIILNSADYPGLPPQRFCQRLQAAGYCTIAVQRPGFGASTPAPTPEGQARILNAFLERAGLADIVLMAMGSGVPIGYRLAELRDDIAVTLLANPTFNAEIFEELRPEWFARLVEQAMASPAMARASLTWIKGNARLFGHHQLFEKWYSKHPGDLEFLKAHGDEFDEVVSALLALDTQTFRNEIIMSLQPDPFLTQGRFSGRDMLAISSEETSASWKRGFEAEVRRLGLSRAYLPAGDSFAPFLFPDRLVGLVEQFARQARPSGLRNSIQA